MGKAKKRLVEFVHALSPERLKEFEHMSAKARLQWLEEANAFINKTLGIEKRAEFDERFKVFLKKTRRKAS